MSYDNNISIVLMAGRTIKDTADLLKKDIAVVQDVAKSIGWDSSWVNVDSQTKLQAIERLAVDGELNLREIGEIFGLSRERVRQLLKKKDINIKELRMERLDMLSDKVGTLLSTGEYTNEDGANVLGISVSQFVKARMNLTGKEADVIESRTEMSKADKDFEYMAKAREMWPAHLVSEIAAVYNIKVNYMNQIIMKYRKLYNWFPVKRKTLKRMEESNAEG